ncbi:hypothetical protein FA95DRAFT_1567838, partial [Auriscalpium vulgare]
MRGWQCPFGPADVDHRRPPTPPDRSRCALDSRPQPRPRSPRLPVVVPTIELTDVFPMPRQPPAVTSIAACRQLPNLIPLRARSDHPIVLDPRHARPSPPPTLHVTAPSTRLVRRRCRTI